MGNTEEEFVEEWVQDSQNGSQVPLDHLVSLYGYALLGLEDSDETVRFRKVEPNHEVEYVSNMTQETEQHYSEETDQKVEEREYEEPKRRVRYKNVSITKLFNTFGEIKQVIIRLNINSKLPETPPEVLLDITGLPKPYLTRSSQAVKFPYNMYHLFIVNV
ncbi:hypothetical protein B9Z55_008327 [Caenorhabditis nigoni]|uniref:Uncharacterized protein n=1 Tax=Caenorhabditis nigoni TaxID=1611254 RepID=A0A2G5VDV5_9PELO|nr:hypothetical protein B9Z55_008327 [Caenorhabditis nigoni]